MTPDDIINEELENEEEEEEDQEPEINIIDLNNYGMKPYSYYMAGGGGSFAPDITDPQDGDTLVYNAAQQKWVNGAGGGGGKLVINAILTEDAQADSGIAVEANHTFAEIAEALENGLVCELWARFYNENDNYIYQMSGFTNIESSQSVIFNHVDVNPYEPYQEFIICDSTNGWYYAKSSYTGNS